MSEELGQGAELGVDLAMEEAERGQAPRWVDYAAFSCLLMAMLMAVGSLLAGITANEALIDRQKQIAELSSSNFLELENEIIQNRIALHQVMGKPVDPELVKQAEAYDKKSAELSELSEKEVEESEAALHIHEILIIGVTILSVGISLTGLATMVRKKKLWFLALFVSTAGVFFLVKGLVEFIVG